MTACVGCGAQSCSHLWPEQKKCCPDCSHTDQEKIIDEIKFIGPKDSVRSPSGLPMLIQKNGCCNAPGSEGN